jgi:hypothetical protein
MGGGEARPKERGEGALESVVLERRVSSQRKAGRVNYTRGVWLTIVDDSLSLVSERRA